MYQSLITENAVSEDCHESVCADRNDEEQRQRVHGTQTHGQSRSHVNVNGIRLELCWPIIRQAFILRGRTSAKAATGIEEATR